MAKKEYNSWELPEVRIRIGEKLHEQLNNISDNTGESLSSLVRPKLREIVESYPEEMKRPKKD